MEYKLLSLRAYCGKYLVRNSPNYRSNCMIKMLLCIPVNNFKPDIVAMHSAKYEARMAKVPLNYTQQSAEIEILPYEDLWQLILNNLRMPKRARKSAADKKLFEAYL